MNDVLFSSYIIINVSILSHKSSGLSFFDEIKNLLTYIPCQDSCLGPQTQTRCQNDALDQTYADI